MSKKDPSERSIDYRRSLGVQKAWGRERELVSKGRGTRDWTLKQQKEILKTGKCKGFQGHHMKSVAKHPEYADHGNNIQLLSARKGNNEHLKAHKGAYKNPSDGRYNVKTGKIRQLGDGEPRAMQSHELSKKLIDNPRYVKYANDPKFKDGKSPVQRYANSKPSDKAKGPSKYKNGSKGSGDKPQFKRAHVKESSNAKQSGKASVYGRNASNGARKGPSR